MEILSSLIGFLLGIIVYYSINRLNPQVSIINISHFKDDDDNVNKKIAKKIVKENFTNSKILIINMCSLSEISDDFFYYLLKGRYKKFGDNFLDFLIINKNNCKIDYSEKLKMSIKKIEKKYGDSDYDD